LKPMPAEDTPSAAEEKTTRFVPRAKKARTYGQPTPAYSVRTTSGWQPRRTEAP
jgi:hypothetical protein